MNRIEGTISTLETNGSITLVSLATRSGIVIKLLLIDTPDTAAYLFTGAAVTAYFKETEIILSKNSEISSSIPNKIPAKIERVVTDHFLTRVYLSTAIGPLSALVHTGTFQNMNLTIGEDILALVKMNEIMLAK
ncbi:MAG: TOBE domain-containing protein [Leeuwenhoekiella sp.]